MNLKCLFLGHAWGEWGRLQLTAKAYEAASEMERALAKGMERSGYRRRICKRCGEWQSEFKKP